MTVQGNSLGKKVPASKLPPKQNEIERVSAREILHFRFFLYVMPKTYS